MSTTIVAPQSTTARSGMNYAQLVSRLGPLVGLIFVFGLFALLRPAAFLSWSNMEVMLLQTAVVGTAALGMTMVIITGGIDLSVGSSIALCTVTIALLLQHGCSPMVAAVGGILTGTLCGALIGTLITWLRLMPFIVTLGTWGSLRGLAKGLANETMVQAPDTWLNFLLKSVSGSDSRSGLLLPWGVWIMLVLAVLVAGMLRYTRFGRHIFAVGSNEQTARLCGVATNRTKLLVYSLAGAMAGVAGVLQFSYLTVGDPTTAVGMELDIIAAVVIGGASLSGGQGSVVGALIGALLMRVVANGCQQMELPNWVQEIVTGGIIIVAVTVDRLRQRKE